MSHEHEQLEADAGERQVRLNVAQVVIDLAERRLKTQLNRWDESTPPEAA